MSDPDGPAGSPQSSPAPLPFNPPGSMLAWYSVIAFVIYAVASGWFAHEQFDGKDMWLAEAAGQAAAGFIMAHLIAWITYHGSGRNRLWANVIFCALLLTFFVRHLAQHDQLTRDDRRVAQIAAEHLRTISAKAAEYGKAVQAFQDAGGNSPRGLEAQGALERRLALLDELEKLNEELSELQRQSLATLERRVRDEKIDAQVARNFLAGARSSSNPELAEKIRETDRRIFRGSRSVLMLLDRTRGQWTHDPETEEVTFADDESAGEYNHWMGRINAAAEEQEAVMQEMIEKSKQRLDAPQQ